MRGKEKCKALKEIRRQIAEENDIPYVVSQCTHQGDCRGTCPKCEAELRYLERELAIRQGLGKVVAVVGISTSVCAGLTACSPVEMVRNVLGNNVEDLAGTTSSADPRDAVGFEEAPPELEQIEDQLESEQIERETEIHSTAPEESTEPRQIDEATAGAIPIPEETEELVMGEVLPPEETVSELEGDIAFTEDWENSAVSQAPMEGGQ
ncbi:MAG: hypothetical protein K2O34_02815 [Acetatifactor sp.]|nr:hypothetical protein [Acetatifactor sp.]